MMITDKHNQTLIFWCQKSNSRSPTSNLLDKPSVLQHWAVWLIITKFIKQKWTLQECFENKTTIWSPEPDQEARRNFANAKVPSKINNFEGLEKVCHKFSSDFPLEETRHASPNLDRERSAKYRYSSNMAEHDSSHISSLTILDQAKGQIPTLNLPPFQNIFLISIFFQIWRFSFWRLFSVGDSIARFERFD